MNRVFMRRIALLFASVAFLMLAGMMMVVASMQDSSIHTGISLPYTISCTSICVNRVASYDGPFYEDGTGREVVDIAALEICNQGDVVIPYACIVVTAGKTQYTFQATMIPVDTPVLVQESYAQPYFTDPITHIFGWNTVSKCYMNQQVTITETAMSELTLFNHSTEPVAGLKLYYRTYYPEGNIYCGGKAFSVAVPEMLPGETRKLYPDYYVSGYSRIVYIK